MVGFGPAASRKAIIASGSVQLTPRNGAKLAAGSVDIAADGGGGE